MIRHDEAIELAERVIAIAGADAEVTITASDNALLRFADGQAVQHSSSREQAVQLQLRDNGRYGEARAQSLDDASLEGLVVAARRQAEALPPDPDPLESVGPQRLPAVIAHHDDATPASFDADARAEAALAMSAAARKSGLCATGVCGVSETFVGKATSNGMRGSYAATSIDLNVTVEAAGAAASERDWSRSRAPLDPEALGLCAAEIAQRARNPVELDPGPRRVVLAPEAVATILDYVTRGFNARDVIEGRSYLVGRVGQPIAGENIQLTQNICHPDLQMEPFDGDGIGLRRVELIRDGVAAGLLHDRRTAAEMDAEPTGYSSGGRLTSGAFGSAYCLNGGTADDEALIEACGDGVLVRRLWYTNWVDPKECVITGMTRDGTFRIRDGKLAEPVMNLRFNQPFLELLSNVEVLGVPRARGRVVAPAILADGFVFSSGTSF